MAAKDWNGGEAVIRFVVDILATFHKRLFQMTAPWRKRLKWALRLHLKMVLAEKEFNFETCLECAGQKKSSLETHRKITPDEITLVSSWGTYVE